MAQRLLCLGIDPAPAVPACRSQRQIFRIVIEPIDTKVLPIPSSDCFCFAALA
jgi:hypothetical protein